MGIEERNSKGTTQVWISSERLTRYLYMIQLTNMPRGIYDHSKYPQVGFQKGINPKRWSLNPSYKTIHDFVRRYKKKPVCCEICKETSKRLELANKHHIYTRNTKDYMYLCKDCHCSYDMLMEFKKHKAGYHRKYNS